METKERIARAVAASTMHLDVDRLGERLPDELWTQKEDAADRVLAALAVAPAPSRKLLDELSEAIRDPEIDTATTGLLWEARRTIAKLQDALAASTVPPAPEPVAWRVKDYAGGWILFNDQGAARQQAQDAEALIQPLYLAAAPVPPDTASVRAQALEEAARIADEWQAAQEALSEHYKGRNWEQAESTGSAAISAKSVAGQIRALAAAEAKP